MQHLRFVPTRQHIDRLVGKAQPAELKTIVKLSKKMKRTTKKTSTDIWLKGHSKKQTKTSQTGFEMTTY